MEFFIAETDIERLPLPNFRLPDLHLERTFSIRRIVSNETKQPAPNPIKQNTLSTVFSLPGLVKIDRHFPSI